MLTSKELIVPIVFLIQQRIQIHMRLNEHNPPHIHAFLGGNEAVFNLKGEMTKGNKKHFRKKDRKLISDWIKEYNTEIRNNWNNIENGEKVCKIQPHTK